MTPLLVLGLAVGCGLQPHAPDSDGDPSPETDTDTDADTDSDTDVERAACDEPGAIHVMTTGSDLPECGDPEAPCRTITHAVGLSREGDAVCVHAGTYSESWIQLVGGTSLISADGPLEARIYSGTSSALRIDGVDDVLIDGFEVYGDWGQGPAGDGLVRVMDAHGVTIRDSMVHDAPYDQDCIKVSGEVRDLLIDGVVVYDPSLRSDGTMYQENIDIFGAGVNPSDPPPVGDVVVRNSWLFHSAERGGDYLIYAKVKVENVLLENNVFGPSGGRGNPAVSIGNNQPGQPDPHAAVMTNAIVRNNVFVGLQGDGAFAVQNAENTWLYNNTFYGNGGALLRSIILFRANTHAVGDTRVFNNVFVRNQPTKAGALFYWVRDGGTPTTWWHDHNLYFGNVGSSDLSYTDEPNGIYDEDPVLVDPGRLDLSDPHVDRIAELRQRFALDAGSPAIGAGIDAVGEAGHPDWEPGITDRRWDFEGDERPAGAAWDLGADQILQ